MDRKSIQELHFPEGLPKLWCPLISHYTREGEFDPLRSAAHISHLKPYVNAFLIPGSTGDGWEMGPPERLELIDMLQSTIERINGKLLVGVLETARGAAVREIKNIILRCDMSGKGAVCGVVVTAPRGENLSQDTIYNELSSVLELGVPTALYQLPQITENEVAPETAARLADSYPNLYLLKDTSGFDRIAEAAVMPEDLFMVRGAEGDYLRWYRAAGGPYDGFLLSTANGFAPQLSRIIRLADEAAEGSGTAEDSSTARGSSTVRGSSTAEDGGPDGGKAARKEAEDVSRLLSKIVAESFKLCADLPFGNPFANSNKVVDHWMAYGRMALKRPMPMTHSGNILPSLLVERIGDMVKGAGLMPEKGYLE